jgi:hypothetical protein
MALVLADRVLETTTSTGSGTITLAGAEPGYQSFSVVGNGNQTYYTIAGDVEWEVGIGTYTSSGTTLSRDTVLSSSDSGNKVTFSAGQKKVFVTYPSEKSVNFDVSGNISVSSAIITNVAEPIIGSDAATKLYVDTLAAQGISYHEPVKYEVPNTTGNLTATYNNGTAGVSATLTNAGSLVPFIPDGITASISDRVLVYNQTNAYENGVYVVSTVGNGSTAWVLTRAADADTYGVKSPTELGGGDAFFVTSGNTGAGETYICNNPSVIIFGSTAITFAQISSAQVYQAGNGISITNTTISLATPVSVANGGTGQSAAPSNGQLLIGNGVSFVLSTLTAGSGISITNSAGSITLSATNSGAVTSVTASSPLASSGGATPNISIANSTGTGSVVLDQGATISSATITAAVSASITTITGSSANITTVTGTTAGFSSAAITQLSGTSAGITTVSGTTTTFSSGTITQFGATSATIATVSGTNATYSNGSFTSATVTNLNSTSANITTLTGTTFGTTATTHLRAISAEITTITGTTIGTTTSATIRGVSGAITTISGTTATFTSASVTNLALTSLTLANLSITSANVTTLTGTNLTYTSGTVTNLNSTSANITTLTGTTFGTTATTQIRANSLAVSATGARWDANGDVWALRSGGTTGVVYLNSAGTRYLFWDSVNYTMPGANLFVNGVQAVTNSGTWAINISGTATYATNTTQSFASNWNTDFSNTPAGSTKLAGDTSTGSSTGGPGGTWWFQQNMRHTNSANLWGVQVAWGWEDNANILRTRNVTAGTYGSWVTYINSSNVSSYVTPLPTVNVTSSTSIAATNGNHYILRGGATTVTLPASPAAGNVVWVTVSNGRSDNVVARNGQNIQGLAENMTLDSPYAAVQLRFSDATMGWVFC